MSKKQTQLDKETKNEQTLQGNVWRNHSNNPEHFNLVTKKTPYSLPLEDAKGNIELLKEDERKAAFGTDWRTSQKEEVIRFRLSVTSFELWSLSMKTLAVLKKLDLQVEELKTVKAS